MHKLLRLQYKLALLGLTDEVNLIKALRAKYDDEIISEAALEHSSKNNIESLYVVFDMVGIPTDKMSVSNLMNAGVHLSKGINVTNLFRASILITSMIAGLSDCSKILEYVGKPYKSTDLQILQPIAQKILNNEGNIRAIFSRLKTIEVTKRLSNFDNGQLIIKYNEKLSAIIIQWATKLISSIAENGLDAIVRMDSK